MDARRLKWLWIAPPALALALGALLGWAIRPPAAAPAGFEPMGIAAAVLVSLRDEGRITPFSARFVAVAEASERRLGLTASKTLIMPGTVRYGVDLSRLRRESLAWDAPTRTLTVGLPPLEMSAPDIDLNEVQEYSEGGIVMALTNSERELDQANRRSAQDELMRQARARTPMHPARSRSGCRPASRSHDQRCFGD